MATVEHPLTAGRIVLGTVQLGIPYGRRSGAEPMPEEKVQAILDRAWHAGVRQFDTAESYGTAAERLSAWLSSSLRASESSVVTKVPLGDAADRHRIREACLRFRGVGSLAVLTHGAPSPKLYSEFAALVGECGAIPGVSVYTADEIRSLCGVGVARVQAPMNVVDRRQLSAANAAGIPFDARSVYLQGVLLDEPDVAESRVAGGGRLAKAVRDAAHRAGISPAVGLLGGALAALGPRDRLVVGVDTPSELDVFVHAASAPAELVRAFVSAMAAAVPVSDIPPGLLDPRTWKR